VTNLEIQNEIFSAAIDPHGAQLASLRRLATGEELIWQRDRAFWGESAPICFPVVGALNNGGYCHNGTWYKISKHGCVRYRDFTVTEHTESALALAFKADELSMVSYPFDFVLTITFTLTNTGITVAYNAQNNGNQPMPMSLGYHPAFAFAERSDIDEYAIEFSTPENKDLFGIKENGDFGLRKRDFLLDQTTLPLKAGIFDQDALVFKNIKSQVISLVREGWRLDMHTGGAPHLALWAPPGAPFVCIEPWYFCPDEPGAPQELSQKDGIMILQPGTHFESAYQITV